METIETIQSDFENGEPPFDDIEFPEDRLFDELPWATVEGKLRILSIFSMFDYNRNADQLAGNVIELYEKRGAWFAPIGVPESKETVEQLFSEIGFRYPSRDAAAFVKNNRIVREKYHGHWSELLMSAKMSATGLVEQLRDDDFKCLKGDKIAPMYAKIIDKTIIDLDDVWDLDIAVDTHIERLSKDLFDDDSLSRDEIRQEWRRLAVEEGVSRDILDSALWQIGNNWNDWGQAYWSHMD